MELLIILIVILIMCSFPFLLNFFKEGIKNNKIRKWEKTHFKANLEIDRLMKECKKLNEEWERIGAPICKDIVNFEKEKSELPKIILKKRKAELDERKMFLYTYRKKCEKELEEIENAIEKILNESNYPYKEDFINVRN